MTELSRKQRAVLEAVYRYSWQSVHPGNGREPSRVRRRAAPTWRVAADANMTDETARSHIRALRDMGLVTYTPGRGTRWSSRVGGRPATVTITNRGLQLLGAPDPEGDYHRAENAARAVNAARSWNTTEGGER